MSGKSMQFNDFYKKYTNAYSSKDYDQCLKLFSQIDLKKFYSPYTVQVNFVLHSGLHAACNVQKPEYNITIANGWKSVLFAISESNDYEKFVSLFNYFFQPSHLKSYLPLVSTLKPSIFDLSEWLNSINKYLFNVLDNAIKSGSIVPNDGKRKEIYLQLTQILLIFVSAEAKQAATLNSRWEFRESRIFLKNCKQFKLFEDCAVDTTIQQYITCFDLLSKFLSIITTECGEMMASAMQQFLNKIKSINASNELRATLVQDNFVTYAKILGACDVHFAKTIDTIIAKVYYDLINYIIFVLRLTKTDKKFCDSKDNCNALASHCSNDLTLLAIDTYSALIEKGVDDDTTKLFANIIQYGYEAISKLKCSKAFDIQRDTIAKLNLLVKSCETNEKAKFIIPILEVMCKYYSRYKLMDGIKNYDIVYLINWWFKVVSAMNNADDIVHVGFLMLAFHSVQIDHPFNIEHTAWTVAKRQRDNKMIISPFDVFKKRGNLWIFNKMNLQLPENFNLNKMTLVFLKIGFKYNVSAPELNNRIVHQMLMMACNTKPIDIDTMRFVLSMPSMKFDSVTNERIDKLIKLLHAKSKEDKSIALQLAVVKYLRFNYEITEFNESHNDLHISESLTEGNLASETNIFRKITFDYEKNQMDTLRYVKKRFIDFVNFYISKTTDDERKLYEDEKELLLRELKVMANQFIVRGFIEDGMDLYMSLFKLSTEVNDEFGVIDACSFFAENSADFNGKKDELNTIINTCYESCTKKLKQIHELSTRKQIQLCFCLLNLVLYYCEQGDNHKREINLILSYMFKAIGGTGIEATSNAMFKTEQRKSDSNKMPKIQSEAVRIKLYSVLFTITTKYNAPCAFHPTKFVEFATNHLRKFLSLYYDNTATIPIMMLNMVPQMVWWLESRYEIDIEIPALMSTLLKLAVKSGYAFRTINLLVAILQTDLMQEKLKTCTTKFKALENIMISNAPIATDYVDKKSAIFTVDDTGLLCEPIRKRATSISPIKCLSPKQVTKNGITNQFIKFLPKHANGCKCGVCSCPKNRFLMFCVAVAYARFTYLNNDDFDVNVKRAVFTELKSYWESSRKERTLPKNDMYYVVSARMLMYYSHFLWKFEKKYEAARDEMRRGSRGMDRVKHGANALKFDLQYQINEMQETIDNMHMTYDEKFGGLRGFMSRQNKFNLDTESEMKKPKVPIKNATKSKPVVVVLPQTPNPRKNLIDMVKDSINPSNSINFQIHDDETIKLNTPSMKKSTRGRTKKVDETPKSTIRPKRNMKSDNEMIDLTSPPETTSRCATKFSSETTKSTAELSKLIEADKPMALKKCIPTRTSTRKAKLNDAYQTSFN